MILRLTDDERREIASKLPQGRVFESGRAFVPFVNKTLYEQLIEMGGETPPIDLGIMAAALNAGSEEAHAVKAEISNAKDERSEEAKEEKNDTPAWSSIKVGSVVLVNEKPKEGWFEAVVTVAKAGGLLTLKWRD
jgi:hypothetical protein